MSLASAGPLERGFRHPMRTRSSDQNLYVLNKHGDRVLASTPPREMQYLTGTIDQSAPAQPAKPGEPQQCRRDRKGQRAQYWNGGCRRGRRHGGTPKLKMVDFDTADSVRNPDRRDAGGVDDAEEPILPRLAGERGVDDRDWPDGTDRRAARSEGFEERRACAVSLRSSPAELRPPRSDLQTDC
jgi:hypothetical protein